MIFLRIMTPTKSMKDHYAKSPGRETRIRGFLHNKVDYVCHETLT